MAPHDPLSPRQRQFVETIARLTADRGFPPTLREIAREMKVHFTRAHQLARSTEWKGFVRREPKVARSLRVTKPAAKPGR